MAGDSSDGILQRCSKQGLSTMQNLKLYFNQVFSLRNTVQWKGNSFVSIYRGFNKSKLKSCFLLKSTSFLLS